MKTLNREAAKAMMAVGVSAATDVTGFGFLGHLAEIASASAVAVSVHTAAVPVLGGAWELLDAGFYPGGSERNVAAVTDRLLVTVPDRTVRMLADAQTSGGLLMAAAPDRADLLCRSIPGSTVVGRVTDRQAGTIALD